MSYLVRKIKPSLWPDWEHTRINNIFELSADTITNDLKTTDNTLSLWEIESLDEMKDIAVAMATTRDEIQDFLIIAIPKNSIEKIIKIENNDLGQTAFFKYKNNHYDMVAMTFYEINEFASLICETLKDKTQTYNFIFHDDLQYIKEIYNAGLLDKEYINNKKKLNKYIVRE